MICQRCKAEIDDALILCPHCGNDLTAPARTAGEEPAPLPVQVTVEKRTRPKAAETHVRAATGISTWVWFLILAVLLSCVTVAFVAAGLGGIYQGLKERQLISQARAQEHYQRGLEHLQVHETELAMAEFEEALRLDPGRLDAYEYLKELRVASRTQPTPTSAVVQQAVDNILDEAEAAEAVGEWEEALVKLEQVRSLDSTFRPDTVGGLLFKAHMAQGKQLLQEKRLEEALRSFNSALEIKPDDEEARHQKELITTYIRASGYWGANWELAIEGFSELYQREPDFIDVQERLHEALTHFAELLEENEYWCDAADAYEQALELKSDSTLRVAYSEAGEKCQANPDSRRPEETRLAYDSAPTPIPGPGVTETSPITPGRTPTTEPATREVISTPTTATELQSTPESEAEEQETATTEPTGKPTGIIAFSAPGPDQRSHVSQIDLNRGNLEPAVLVQEGSQPAFSRDGSQLAFRSLRSDINGLRVSDSGGRNGNNVTKFIEDTFPSWSPDGTQLVFGSTRESDRRPRIFTTWAGGLGDSVLITLGEYPSWSIQGPIAYHGCDPSGGNCGIWTMAPDGGGKAAFTTHESDTAPCWSPDGSRLAFMSARDGNWEIYTASADGGQAQRMTENSANDGMPTWSPDGNWIAFISNRAGSWGIYVVAASGGEAQKIVDLPDLGAEWMEQGLSWRR